MGRLLISRGVNPLSFDRVLIGGVRMGRTNGANARKTGIFLRACSPVGLDRVLILDGFQPESRPLTVSLIAHPHSMWRSMA